MDTKIFGVLKRICAVRFRGNQFSHKKCQNLSYAPIRAYPTQDTIKLAILRLTPTLRLLSFRVSRNYLYFSFARPETDLLEFNELCDDETSD